MFHVVIIKFVISVLFFRIIWKDETISERFFFYTWLTNYLRMMYFRLVPILAPGALALFFKRYVLNKSPDLGSTLIQ
jgi:hypothetical protein